MTNPQTEARAIAERWTSPEYRNGLSKEIDTLVATALSSLRQEIAAKDAELVEKNRLLEIALRETAPARDAAIQRAERAEAELAEVKSKCQALDDECQQSMLDISRERDRAERASALLAEWIEQWAVVKDQLAAKDAELELVKAECAFWKEACAFWKEAAARDQEQLAAYRQSSVHPDDYETVKAQLAKANKALDRIASGTHGDRTSVASHYEGIARRALEAQGEE